MKKILALFGVLMLLPIAAASGAIEVSPSSQNACCETVQYEVAITNTLNAQASVELSVESDEGVKATLQPSIIVIQLKSKETLVMFARPACELPAGSYKITIAATSKGWCDEGCGTLCNSELGKAEAVLTVPDSCNQPEKPPVENTSPEQPQVNNTPLENPPAENIPIEQPPAVNPPVENPPVEQPPAENTPEEQPPVENIEQPPAEAPEANKTQTPTGAAAAQQPAGKAIDPPIIVLMIAAGLVVFIVICTAISLKKRRDEFVIRPKRYY